MAACHMKLDEVDFRIYSKDEILELSVKEIVNPQSFDLLQNPVAGGLHDPALGPCRRDDRCESCGQTEMNCPGHMGHIKLPVLMFNPLLFKTLVKILKGSCLSCHRFNLKTLHKQLYAYQIMLLQKGYLTAAQDLVERFKNSEKAENETVQEMKAFVADILKNSEKDLNVTSKNVLTQFQLTVNSILKSFSSVRPTCVHCHTRNRILKAEFNRTIIGTMTTERAQVKKDKKEEEDHEEEETVAPDGDVEMESLEEHLEKEKADKETPLLTDSELMNEMDEFLKSRHKRIIFSPNIAKEHLKLMWKVDQEFMSRLLPFLSLVKGGESPTDVFFMDVIPVPPSRFRPLSVMRDRKYEHPQTANLSNVLKECVTLIELLQSYKKMDINKPGPSMPEDLLVHMQKITSSCLRLQSRVNIVFDSDLDKYLTDKCNGIKQLLEKKEGLFRMHMMGKRVNFAARSVISPDPYIATKEIGIPMVFATKLTYPQRVTPWNVQQLRQMVINGPLGYPGASSVINEDGTVVRLHPTKLTQREAIAKQLLVRDKDVSDSKIVCRHLINGDYLLLNRQPTLHRLSIQAHRARVLPNIKTLRMHYSNCKAYNADFDGDEMNAHFLQCELSRAEASNIALTDNQYLTPRDGTPLAGLIQDHMVAGVALTVRGRFFTREEYCQLVWGSMNDFRQKITMLPPSIIKPVPLWSGKQIVSTILLNIIPKGKAPLTLKSRAKVPEKSWTKGFFNSLPLNAVNTESMGESTVVVSQGELLQGVLDKAQCGPAAYGLVHCCYELYGGDVAGQLLTYIGRMCTTFLQMTGFSLGVGDILVRKKANKKRKQLIKKSQHVGTAAVVKGLNLSAEDINESDLLLELKKAHFDKSGTKLAEIDMSMKGETDKIQDGIAKSIMPHGLERRFPDNSLQLMVQSGAKGSPVNCMQISCLLGQIELEGRRPPLMLSGRSLPSFLPYDVSPKAGGFVTGRFLTGIRPQEYFFHCMAGREGLIDTAVKTSRSGYLQRCLVKHLEGLMVNYDMTVRDSDGSMVQFYYGEDGIEPVRNPFLKPSLFPFLAENVHTLVSSYSDRPWLQKEDKSIKKAWKKISKWKAQSKESNQFIKRESGFLEWCKSEDAPKITKAQKKAEVTTGRFKGRTEATKILCEAWEGLGPEEREEWSKIKMCPDPVMSSQLPHAMPDILSERFRHLLNVFCKKGLAKVVSEMSQDLQPDSFKAVMNKKVLESMAHPGEAVGLVCAQSIGEPSTQMTLNTFHFAGRGEMNVTLGIPRLREILMTGSSKIKTPSMDVPVHGTPEAKTSAQWLQRHLTKITLDQVMEYLKLKVMTRKSMRGTDKVIEAKFKFLPAWDYAKLTNVTPHAILKFLVKKFLPGVNNQINKEVQMLESSSFLSSGRFRRTKATENEEGAEENADLTANNNDDNNDDEVDVDPNNDGDMSAVKEAQRQTDTQEYEGEEEERQELGTDKAQDEDDDDDVAVNESISGEKKDDQEVEEEEDEDSSDDEAEMRTEDLSKVDQNLVKEALSRAFVEDFKFDQKKIRWCTVTFIYDQNRLPLDVRMLFEKTVRQSVIHHITGVSRAFLSEINEDGESVLHLKTEGVNIQEMFKYPDTLDLNKLHSNCIHTMANTYGIEAANRVIIKEIQGVFGAYGITVDYRHLSLLADYMTVRGEYDAFNRRDISYNTSPLQKMTFETTMHFLLDGIQSGEVDKLQSPSAQLVLGKPVGVGTGCFDILDPLLS